MIGREVLGTALHRFRTHPLQTWLTLAGLIVGTAAIIIIVALGLSGRAFVMSQIEAVGSHVVWATYEGNVTSGVRHAVDDSINESDVHAIAARTDLFSAVTPLVQMNGSVAVEARTINVAVLGTTPNYIEVRKNVHILRGRFIDEDDLAQRAKVAVVSKDLYAKLFHNDDTEPKKLRILGMTLLMRAFIDRFAIQVSALSAILAFAFSSAVTLLFGVVPAYRAAQLNPTDALRYE